MKFIYELALNHRDLIIKRVIVRCNNDAYINNACGEEEIKNNIIQHLYGGILDSLKNSIKSNVSMVLDEGDTINNWVEEAARQLLSKNNDTKLVIAFIKNFRSALNEVLLEITEDKSALFNLIECNITHFDIIELAVLNLPSNEQKEAEIMQDELIRQAMESKKLLHETLENEKARTEFFSNLSHELRTPLNVILGTLQLVDMYSSSNMDSVIEKTKKYYKIMRQNCYRLLRLVNNLIDLNKLDAGYMPINIENHDIVSIVSKIAASVSDYIENKGIHFVYHTSINEKVIACDPDKIERILLNLLSNAIKFTDCGGEIQVNIWGAENKLFISVKDNGIGIPEEKQDLVFGRFVQIDKSLARNHQGSGIGLSLVKSLVELHGGKVSLISESGKGCEFIIELPVQELEVMETTDKQSEYNSNNRIEIINIEFSDIYS